MAMATTVLISTSLVLLLFLAGGIVLEIFLARSESIWPGLILPGLFFLISLIMPLNVAVSDGVQNALILAFLVFLLANIPTAILLAIYFACRGRNRKKKLAELDRMNIQDLE